MTLATTDPTLPERWSTGQRVKNTFIYYAVRVLIGLARLLPRAFAAGLGAVLGRIGYVVARRERRWALEHLQIAFGNQFDSAQRQRIARDSFIHLGRCAGEALRVQARAAEEGRSYVFDGESRAIYEAALAEGRGVIFCTGHIGNWELFAQVMARLRPVWTVARRAYDPRITRLIDGYRSAGGVYSLWRGERPLRELIAEVLGRGEVMGFLIDQDMKVPGVFVPFFGKPAYTSNAPALLAISTRAVVLAGHSHRIGGVHHLTIRRLRLDWSLPPDEAVLRLTTDISAYFEEAIRAHPEQWVWMHRRWKTKPPSATAS